MPLITGISDRHDRPRARAPDRRPARPTRSSPTPGASAAYLGGDMATINRSGTTAAPSPARDPPDPQDGHQAQPGPGPPAGAAGGRPMNVGGAAVGRPAVSARPLRRVGLLAGSLLVAAGAPASAATASSIDDTGWWSRANQDATIGGALVFPDVSAGQLLVEGTPEGATAIAALRATLPEGTGQPVLTLHAASATGGDTAVLLACQAGSGWTGAHAGAVVGQAQPRLRHVGPGRARRRRHLDLRPGRPAVRRPGQRGARARLSTPTVAGRRVRRSGSSSTAPPSRRSR